MCVYRDVCACFPAARVCVYVRMSGACVRLEQRARVVSQLHARVHRRRCAHRCVRDTPAVSELCLLFGSNGPTNACEGYMMRLY